MLKQIERWLSSLSGIMTALMLAGGVIGFAYLVYNDHRVQELDKQRYEPRLELVPQADGERIRAVLTNKGSQVATITSVSINITGHEELPAEPTALIVSRIPEEVAGTFMLPTESKGMVQQDVAFKVDGNEVEALLLVPKVRDVSDKSQRRKHRFDAILSFTYDGGEVSKPLQFAVTSEVGSTKTRVKVPKPGQGAAAPGAAAPGAAAQ